MTGDATEGWTSMANASRNEGKSGQEPEQHPPQSQSHQPGTESKMTPEPIAIQPDYKGSGKLKGRRAVITGGDSGIGRAVALHFAAEGADVAIHYLDEPDDAQKPKTDVEKFGRTCELISGDIASSSFCREAINRAAGALGGIDVLVNNAAVQFPRQKIEDIAESELERTFRVNIFAMFHLVSAAMPHLETSHGASIINTTSVTAYRGSPSLLDYSATKGAIVTFTRSLSGMLAKKNIRVNAVAP
jgi:NAD(P)-dependent dehydrogenase (short-subunit alcohol dehydrogenase family)